MSLDTYRSTEERLAPAMFGLAIVFLIGLAALIVAWVDIPRVVELALEDGHDYARSDDAAALIRGATEIGLKLGHFLLALWLVFIAEAVYHLRYARVAGASRKNILTRVAATAIPPLRLGTPSALQRGHIWLPVLGWTPPGKAASKQLARFFGKPMIVIALMILPILLLEFGLKDFVARHFWLQLLIYAATGFIWFAFTLEFILMISVSDKRLRYAKENWIDLAIILLPLISFLRGFRALRIARLAKVQQLAKMGRIYRMRGLGMKLFRALLLLEVVNRLLRITPEKQLTRLETLREDHLEELAEIDKSIAELKQKLIKQDTDRRAA